MGSDSTCNGDEFSWYSAVKGIICHEAVLKVVTLVAIPSHSLVFRGSARYYLTVQLDV